MKSSLLMHKHIIVRQLIYSYKTFALLTRGLLSCSFQSKECLNKPNLLQRKLGKFARNIQMSFWLPLRRLATQPLLRISQMQQKVFCGKPLKKLALQEKLETKSKSRSKQTVLQLDQENFKEQQVVSSFVAADIPLHKLNHSSLKSLFAIMGKVLSSYRLQPGHVLLN